MRVSVETGEGLERRLLVDLPAEQLKQKVDSRLKELADRVRLDGFRPGKVPMRVLRQRFGAQVRQEAYGELIQSTFYEAANQQNLRPAGEPRIDLREGEDEAEFGYTATFEVLPEIELADAGSMEIARPVTEIADADVDAMIERLRRQRVTWNPVERPAATGDQLRIDFVGTIDGEVFDGGSAEGVEIELGSGRMISGFEDGLLGVGRDEQRTLDLEFPEDYQAEQLRGKAVQFVVTVHAVSEPVLPEIDEAFARTFGVEDGGVEAMRVEIRGNMERELAQKIRSILKERVMAALLRVNEIEIPAVMVSQEAESLKQQAMAEISQAGQAPQGELPASLFEDQAKRRVTLGLIVGEIIRGQQLKVDEDALRMKIEEFANAYENPQEVIEFYMNDQSQRAAVENLVMEDLVVDWVLDRAKIDEQRAGFDEIMELKG